jgi:hypothetical protein
VIDHCREQVRDRAVRVIAGILASMIGNTADAFEKPPSKAPARIKPRWHIPWRAWVGFIFPLRCSLENVQGSKVL